MQLSLISITIIIFIMPNLFIIWKEKKKEAKLK